MAGTVLVVDDEPSHRRLVRWLLEEAGYRVEVAREGAEALAVLERTSVQLVLLDLHLPGMDGRTCTEALHARGHVQPIVLMSSDWEVHAVAAELSVAGALAKPFDEAALLAAVEPFATVTSPAPLAWAPRGTEPARTSPPGRAYAAAGAHGAGSPSQTRLAALLGLLG